MATPANHDDSRRQSGCAGERAAEKLLQAHGVVILERNFRSRLGELDLVGLDGAILVVVEVRLRATATFGGALASVTRRKQRRIARTTQVYLQRRTQWRHHLIRFDVIALQGIPGSQEVIWIKDAFRT